MLADAVGQSTQFVTCQRRTSRLCAAGHFDRLAREVGVFYVMDYIDTNTDYNGVLYAYSFPSMQLKWSYKFTWTFSPYRAPVVTDKYVIFPVSAGKVVNQATLAAKMVFLDLNGKLVNEFPYHGFPSKFLYVDETGTSYATDVY